MVAEDGREQIIGYHMGGDFLGLDGIGNDRHECDVVALEDSEVCALPFARLDDLARREPALRRNLYHLMSRNLHRGRSMMVLLGSLSAEERLAVFLLDLAERFHRGGYSASEFMLRMTREEIASFLGLKLRDREPHLSRLHGEGVIQARAAR
jgi:CRP/FNR family transcriptional regulator